MNLQIDQPVHASLSPPGVPENLSDREIIDQVLKGDTRLFELLLRRHNRRMFRLVRSILKNRAEAEDAIQEAYILAYLNLRSFKSGNSAAGWLARIAINEALGRLRRNRGDSLPLEENTESGFTVYGPEQFTRTHQALWLIESAIDGLPVNYRAVFMLRAVEQLTIEETAEYLDIKPATVKTRLHRAKVILQKCLGRKLEELAVDAFPFGGIECDRIVARLYATCVELRVSPPGVPR
jgi:RNA polymerase sigma-70 factor (ECF subfamily)